MGEELRPLDNPWVAQTLENILEITRENVLNWCNILTKMGLNGEDQDQWTTIFKQQVSDLYKDMIEEVTVHQDKLFVEIETLLKKSEKLCKDLHMKMPHYGSKDLSLYEEQRLLMKRIESYERLVEEKRKEINSLTKQQSELCHALGKTPRVIPDTPLPSQEFIQDFRVYLESLESEKFTREEKFLEIKSSIMTIVNELNYKPTLDFEKAVISHDDSIFVVTDNNMRELTDFYESIKQQLQDTKEEMASLREKIKFLWELLAEDVQDYDEFLQKHTGNSKLTLEALREELKRCENLKKANIEVFVKRLRGELIDLWDKCHFTDEQRDFEYLHTDLYTEDLLTLHDLEIQKLDKYYLQNKELFTLLEKREELWKKWQTLEQPATDRNRYNNRGGQLLKEEKERNALFKRIPQIEEQLVQLSKDFETRTGKEFLSWGKSVEHIILKARERYDNEKKLKLSARKLQRDKTLTPGKSMLGITPCTSTQNLAAFSRITSSVKRKPSAKVVTPLFPAAKRMRILTENDGNIPKSAPPKVLVNGRSYGPSRYSLERAKRIEKCRRISQRMMKKQLNKENTADHSTEYDVFEKEIQSKESCRSTIFIDNDVSNTPLALPLPLTPLRIPTTSTNTPRRTPGAGTIKKQTPRTASKFSTAPSLKLLF